MRAASATLRDRGWSALPRVENDSRATRGGAARNVAALSAVRIAISASSAAVGSGLTPQSAKISRPWSPISVRGVTISMNDDTFFTPARTPIPRIAARSVSAVVDRAPATIPSNWPEATPDAAHSSGSWRCLRPSSRVTPRRAARSRYARRAASASRPVGTDVQQGHAGDAVGHGARRRLDGAWLGAFGQDDVPGRGAGRGVDPREDIHGTRTLTYDFR